MLHALLHGKLDLELPEPHRREDALTSIVFGTLRMVEAWDVLASWLDVEPLSRGQEGTVECWFWPRLAGAVEPDVVLRLGDTLVVVEAKYRSGRHDLSLDEADERPSDQIERQYKAGSSQRSVQLRPVYMANKSSINSDLRGWRTPSVSGEELQTPGVRPTGDGGIARGLPVPRG